MHDLMSEGSHHLGLLLANEYSHLSMTPATTCIEMIAREVIVVRRSTGPIDSLKSGIPITVPTDLEKQGPHEVAFKLPARARMFIPYQAQDSQSIHDRIECHKTFPARLVTMISVMDASMPTIFLSSNPSPSLEVQDEPLAIYLQILGIVTVMPSIERRRHLNQIVEMKAIGAGMSMILILSRRLLPWPARPTFQAFTQAACHTWMPTSVAMLLYPVYTQAPQVDKVSPMILQHLRYHHLVRDRTRNGNQTMHHLRRSVHPPQHHATRLPVPPVQIAEETPADSQAVLTSPSKHLIQHQPQSPHQFSTPRAVRAPASAAAQWRTKPTAPHSRTTHPSPPPLH